ncbi:epilancin biosynthesis-related protein ElxI1, partial [Staphylococcus aureus]|uniref:epilancin biosynthesis-related protein ElxI1 n=1 Tax=Staphylococcus aureus TaxID=1280 RepID=UPI001CD0C205
VLLFSQQSVWHAKSAIEWSFRWYWLGHLPPLPIILRILLFSFRVPSEMIKDRQRKNNGV